MDGFESGAFVTFLRHRRGEILQRWTERVRELPPAADLDRESLIDHLPRILEDIEMAAESVLKGVALPQSGDHRDRHALARLHQG